MSGRREAALGLGAYAAYLGVRAVVWNDAGRWRARRNAERIAAVERRLGLDIEPAVQSWALRAPVVVRVFNAGYAVANIGLTVGWLMWLHHRRDPRFRRERRAALLTFAGALPVFVAFPTAPPRWLDGFVDTIAGDGRGLDHPFLVRFYNPIAAMPSHHMAFAVVTGVGLADGAHRSGIRRWWRAYPGLVAVVVMATANHFVLDVAAGSALGAISRRVAR